jgi:hypothetical protein
VLFDLDFYEGCLAVLQQRIYISTSHHLLKHLASHRKVDPIQFTQVILLNKVHEIDSGISETFFLKLITSFRVVFVLDPHFIFVLIKEFFLLPVVPLTLV